MTHYIPIPADRNDYGGQNVQTRQAWKTQARSPNTESAHMPARTASANIVLNRADTPFRSMMADPAHPQTGGFESALAQSEIGNNPDTQDVFEFEDVIDIINPLHHLPVVGMVYRSLTNDTIKPMASIIGGGIFGGPMGAAGGVMNAVIEHETGKDIAGNVLALVRDGNTTGTSIAQENISDDPETRLAYAAQAHGLTQTENRKDAPPPPFAASVRPEDLPGTALSFVDLSAPHAIEKKAVADGRTAGWTLSPKQPEPQNTNAFNAIELVANALPARERISTVSIEDF